MKKFFIETSVIVDYLRNKERAVNLVDNLEGDLTSSYICLAELYEGIYRVKNFKEAEEGVLNFFSSLSEIYGIEEDISRNFGQIRANLKKRGNVLEDLDIFIAATCVANDLIMITFNQEHFMRVDNLQISHS
jgi:predicted nucleic acid-binding protein